MYVLIYMGEVYDTLIWKVDMCMYYVMHIENDIRVKLKYG